MNKEKFINGLDFFELLNKSNEFTSALGKATLASSKLEAELIIFVRSKNIHGNFKKATLGNLIDIADRNNLLTNNEAIALRMILKQRNYITHNLYSLFASYIDETILERENLLECDIHLYIERALTLKQNVEHLTNIIKDK